MHQRKFTSRQTKSRRWRSPWLWIGLFCGLIVTCLACGLVIVALQSEQISTTVADLFATSMSTAAVPTPTWTPAPTPTPTPTPTVTPTPPGSTPVAVGPAEGWSFEGVHIQPDPSLDGVLVYGEAVNNTDAPQRILGLQGTFYDTGGQTITPGEFEDYWPIETVPPGGRMPFELTLYGPSSVDRVELRISAEPGNEPPRTDFDMTEVEGIETETEFCVKGRVRNLGQPLAEYLMVVAVLYDEDDRVINWGIGYEPADAFAGEEPVPMSACAERFNRIVARHELRAWGL